MKALTITAFLMILALGASGQEQQDKKQDTTWKKPVDTRRDHTKVIKEELRTDTAGTPVKEVPEQDINTLGANENCVIRFDEIDYTKDPE